MSAHQAADGRPTEQEQQLDSPFPLPSAIAVAPPVHPPARRRGQDGRLRPVHADRQRDAIERTLRAHPNMSLREVHKATGASPTTVAKVRAGLRAAPVVGPVDVAVQGARPQPVRGPAKAAARELAGGAGRARPAAPAQAKHRWWQRLLARIINLLALAPRLRR